MIISNASSILLTQNSGTVPDVSDAMMNWFQQMTFTTIVKTVVNFNVVETPTNVQFLGTWQPFTLRQLLMKPEGQRAWRWFQVHAQPSLQLTPDEIITFLGVQYRVKDVGDYSIYGYMLYNLIEDYSGAGP